MNRNEEHEALLIAQGEAHLIAGQTSGATTPGAKPAPRKMGFGQKIVVAILLTIVLVPPLGGFYSYFSGIPLHLLASSKEVDKAARPFRPSERLRWSRVKPILSRSRTKSAPPWESARANRTRSRSRGSRRQCGRSCFPVPRRFDPTRLARIRARFAPARVVSLAQVWDYSPQDRTNGIPRAEAR